ncbi:MAG: hypothetical protein M5U28_45300 [Sandaracinaceae bacterium]|nr:hypothetical protein [Sandaracinaceae bacterium]
MGIAMAIACDSPEPEEDAGTDAGNVDPDAGRDGGRDAGGGDCQGPPGLYAEGSCDVLAAGVRAYQPRFVLWSDAADKERYIYLPPGTQIDTTDPDNWVFPTGTRIYKNFLHDGVRLETRVLEKHGTGTGPASWYMRAYAWNAAQDRVTEVQDADITVRSNVLGTQHDIPSQAQCIECHSGVLDTSNSFSAIQLNHDLGGLNLQMLVAEGLLTTPIALEQARIPDTMGATGRTRRRRRRSATCTRTAATATGTPPARRATASRPRADPGCGCGSTSARRASTPPTRGRLRWACGGPSSTPTRRTRSAGSTRAPPTPARSSSG